MASDWTFLTNHAHVLVYLSAHPDVRVRDLADAVGVTERSVMTILADLEEGGYVTRKRVGRRNEYRIDPQLRFRHPAEANQRIGKLLEIFSGTA
ncbi:MAG: MarR family transcriptional regulator [Actinomycetales bacterium]|nr:MarR family transcriptional regulator [Actinomycetales bacterium]